MTLRVGHIFLKIEAIAENIFFVALIQFGCSKLIGSSSLVDFDIPIPRKVNSRMMRLSYLDE